MQNEGGTYNLRRKEMGRMDLQPDEMTHTLVAEQQRGAVSRIDLHKETRRRTHWWQNGSAGRSAGWICTRRRDDAQAGGRTAAWGGQQDAFALGDQI